MEKVKVFEDALRNSRLHYPAALEDKVYFKDGALIEELKPNFIGMVLGLNIKQKELISYPALTLR